MSKIKFTTVSIPKPLYEKIEKFLEGTGFGTVSSFVNFLLRDIVSSGDLNKEGDPDVTEKIRQRLKRMGYIQ